MKITVINHGPLDRVKTIIDNLNRINNFNYCDEIILNYDLDLAGEFFDDENKKIYVNPDNCDYSGEYSVYYVCIHEFGHMLDYKLKMADKFKETFPEKSDHLYINSHSRVNRDEELAELITLYITNPYMLRLISKKHWQFLKKFFKSPTPCSEFTFVKLYKKYSKTCTDNFKRRHGIYMRGNTIYYNE